ncbi:MAG TPA: 50S ribosomal protein L3 [Patescibacteria group bacterium]|nr:50S ribosomal protein L3 [Patescibacteria group bacterium]
MRAILGKKILMSRIFSPEGRQLPVTLIKFDKNTILQIKTLEKDGYQAIQVGSGSKKRLTRAESGRLKKINPEFSPRHFFEIKTNQPYDLGQEITLDQFREGEKVNATATSKGKGFAGTVKRHHFHLGPKTHGSNNYRRPGSIGSTFPERVIKGKRMAGRLGGEKTTVKNLEIIKIDLKLNQILIRGAVPGNKNSSVLLWSKNEN